MRMSSLYMYVALKRQSGANASTRAHGKCNMEVRFAQYEAPQVHTHAITHHFQNNATTSPDAWSQYHAAIE